MRTFINISGGLDSAYFLWRLLSESKSRVLAHHCCYSKRAERERTACRGIMKEMHLLGLTHFDYEETQAVFPRKPDRDIVVMAAMGALVSRRYIVDKVLLCYSREESRELHNWLQTHGKIDGFTPGHRYSRANRAYQELYRKNQVEFYLMEQEKGLISRERMITELPESVLRHISFCREPRPNRRFCGVCFTCRRTIPYLKKHNKVELCRRELS